MRSHAKRARKKATLRRLQKFARTLQAVTEEQYNSAPVSMDMKRRGRITTAPFAFCAILVAALNADIVENLQQILDLYIFLFFARFIQHNASLMHH